MTVEELALLGIDAAQIFYVWSWGFGSVVFFHFLGSVIGIATGVIRKL